jgi:lipoprotein-releasing system permease protein
MNWPYEWQIGWRYTRAGRTGRRNGFISFISAVSMLGIALGVAALIIVLSVMNGFQKEVTRPHAQRGLACGGVRRQGRGPARLARHRCGGAEEPAVVGAAPFIARSR